MDERDREVEELLDRLDPDTLRRLVAEACREDAPRRRLGRGGGRVAWLATSIALLAGSIAIAGEGASGPTTAGNSRGEPVEIQERNRSRGETGLVTSSDDYSLRLSNTKEGGGGGAVYGCRTPTASPAEERACLYADNLRGGEAFLFRSREGSKVGHFDLGNPAGAPFSTNATGLVANLNADRLDDLHAADIIGQARAKAGLVAESADSATNATNADTVDGAHASGLRVKTAFTDTTTGITLTPSASEIMSVPITLDVPSTVMANAMIEIDSDGGGDDRAYCRIAHETYGNGISQDPRGDIPQGAFDRTWFGLTGAKSLPAGTHNIKLFCGEGAGTLTSLVGNLTVIAVPN